MSDFGTGRSKEATKGADKVCDKVGRRLRGPAFARMLRRGKRRGLRGRGRGRTKGTSGSEFGGKKTSAAPGEGFEAEIEDAVEFVKGDSHIKTGFGSGQPIA